MRYFKYKGLQTTEKVALREQYKALTKEEKRLVRKDRFLNTLGNVVFYTIFIVSFGCCFWGLKQIPVPENLFEIIMCHIGKFILGAVALFLCIIISAFVALPIFSNNEGKQLIYQKFLAKACEHLREYYGLQEPCIVTKCYDASDKKFKNHDVCIFVVGDELRITTNLKHGFFYEERDLGCHAFLRDEVTIDKIEGEKFLIAELRAGETTFLLGYRAKGFIEKNFLSSEKDT